ncbi:MAG: gamma-glutamyl-gamma-aminobutyrate hydrolase family protein, partial [Coriobacteriia bacterium]|nr:gamma-glutamyl-gamma-aminobutyrate hydrolase family protein [Coriobacteriia bacterium]
KAKAISPKVAVTLDGKTLVAGTDYRVSYTSNVKAGRAKISVTGIGMYEGAISKYFVIAKKSLKKLKIKACKRQVYTGEKLKPVPTLKHGGLLLEKGVDFTVKYKANKNLGIAKMIIKGKGNYKGKVVKKFKIVPYMVVCMPERYPHRIKDVAAWLGSFGIKAVLVRDANANLNRYDGMVIPGGLDDVHPQFYGEKMNGAERTDPILDRLQMKLIKRFAKTGKPILGICRGCQIMNVTFGGSLYQNIGRHQGYIKTMVKKDTWLSGVGKSTTVYHYHHQAVKDLAKNFKMSAWNYKGKRKVMEAYEHIKKPIFGVQYHPELSGSGGAKLALLFKETCAKYM